MTSDDLKALLLQRSWKDIEAKLADEPEFKWPDELLRLKVILEEGWTEEEQRAYRALMMLADKQKWKRFDIKFGDVSLPAPMRSKLLEYKVQEMERQNEIAQENRRWQARLSEFASLVNARHWRAFDQKLWQDRELLSSKWEHLLEVKADALRAWIPENIRPDSDQARILVSLANNVRVTARAGSGKTRLLTAMTYFLIAEYKCQPHEILLLAFNRDAAGQLEDRLTQLLQIPAFPGARTFHSLAYGIAQPAREIIYDEGEEVWQQQLTMLVQDILRDLLDEEQELRDVVYDLFRRETTEDRATGTFLTGEVYYDFRRALTQLTLGGQSVKSRGEKYIGDFLFEHGITYYYENPTRWEGAVYRPDFRIITRGKSFVIWEHWAVNPDAKHVSESREWPEAKLRDYQAAARRKREFWKARSVPFIESCADACGDRDVFEAVIAAKLRPYFPNLQRLPKAHLMEKLIDVHLSKLARWLGQAIQRAQKCGLDASGFTQLLFKHTASTEREGLFLSLLEKVFAAYAPRLAAEGKTDFDRLFNEAITLLRETPPQTLLRGKQTTIDLLKLRYCLVDEAQDLSPQFIEAISCLRSLNPNLKLMFVGDDWQAINRFAGSDVKLFTHDITARFGKCATATLATNYRSVSKVVFAGNKLMQGQGAAAIPHKGSTGTIQIAYVDKVWVEERESELGWTEDAPFRECGSGLNAFFKALYQLAISDLVNGKTIGVLFRTNKRGGKKLLELEKAFICLLRKIGWPKVFVDDLQKKKIRFSTVHRFKGKECDTVFVVDPFAGSFPLLNADSIELFKFFGDNLEKAEADERRLFYVAITRAKERLVFLTEARRDIGDSPYLETFRDLIDVIKVSNEVILPDQINTLRDSGPSNSEIEFVF
jgi:DNA helicase-4